MIADYLGHAGLYERLGLRVFPVYRLIRGDGGELRCACPDGVTCGSNSGKHPVIIGWRGAEPSITRWWGIAALAKPNIGIVTGIESGIVVLDVDPRSGGNETLAQLEKQYGALPDTWRFLTGGGGEHILFRHPSGYIKSKAGMLGTGLDVKADGGLIVAPPSLHLSDRRYAISPEHHPDNIPLASLPQWLHAKLTRPQRRSIRAERPVRPSRGLSPYGEAALSNACDRIIAARAGTQELTINAEAYSIGRLAGAGALPTDFALRALQYAARRVVSYGAPWRDDQLAAKVERSFAAGTSNPRRVRR